MEKKEEKKVCCICGKEYEGYGYNPFPVKEEGCCCQSCNYSVVVPLMYTFPAPVTSPR